MVDKDVKYNNEIIKAIADKITKEVFDDADKMSQQILAEIVEALDRGEDVYDNLLEVMLTRPFMEIFIDEIIKYEEG